MLEIDLRRQELNKAVLEADAELLDEAGSVSSKNKKSKTGARKSSRSWLTNMIAFKSEPVEIKNEKLNKLLSDCDERMVELSNIFLNEKIDLIFRHNKEIAELNRQVAYLNRQLAKLGGSDIPIFMFDTHVQTELTSLDFDDDSPNPTRPSSSHQKRTSFEAHLHNQFMNNLFCIISKEITSDKSIQTNEEQNPSTHLLPLTSSNNLNNKTTEQSSQTDEIGPKNDFEQQFESVAPQMENSHVESQTEFLEVKKTFDEISTQTDEEENVVRRETSSQTDTPSRTSRLAQTNTPPPKQDLGTQTPGPNPSASRESQTEFGIDYRSARKLVELNDMNPSMVINTVVESESIQQRKKPNRNTLNLDLDSTTKRGEFVIVDWKDFESIMLEKHRTKSIQVQTDTPVLPPPPPALATSYTQTLELERVDRASQHEQVVCSHKQTSTTTDTTPPSLATSYTQTIQIERNDRASQHEQITCSHKQTLTTPLEATPKLTGESTRQLASLEKLMKTINLITESKTDEFDIEKVKKKKIQFFNYIF